MVSKITILFHKKWVIILALLIVSLPAALKLLMPGFFEPHDLHHFADIYEMFRAFASGQMPPRFGPDYLYNFGYPLFNFYYLTPFYLGAFYLWIFGSIQLALKLIFVTSILIGVLGMYFMLREFADKFSAFVGTVVFLYTPYRAVQIYVRGAVGEALSLALTPLVAYFFIKVVKNPKDLRRIGIAGLVGALFILTHNYMWLFSMPWIVVLALIFARKKTFWISLRSLIFSGILMVGASIYWWLPGIIEQKLVASQTPFPLIDHFPFIKQLILPSWGYGASIPGPYDGLSFQIGVINLLAVAFTIFLIVFMRKVFKHKIHIWVSIWGIASFFIVFFLMNIRSYPLWQIMPFHDFVQFPWRFLSFTTFFTAVLAATGVEVLKNNTKIAAGLIFALGSVALTFNYFQPSHTVFKSDSEYLSRFFAFRGAVSEEYKNYSEDYLLLPKSSEQKPDFLPSQKIISDSGSVTDIKEITPVNWTASLTATKSGTVAFYSLNFPGWYAEIDGREAPVNSGKPYGQVEITVPAGAHNIHFHWKETPLRLWSDLAGLAFVLTSLFFVFRRRHATL